jgi:hypothetical protein
MNAIRFSIDPNCVKECELIDIRKTTVGVNQFEVRMFLADIGNGQSVWYGSLQNLKNGEKHYFPGWSGLVANLKKFLTFQAQLEVLNAFAPSDESTD